MDRQDQEDMQLLRRILDAHVGPGAVEPRIEAYHKLRLRHSGRHHWVDFHIQVPADWSLERAHQVANTIEEEVTRALEPADATIHMEPHAPQSSASHDPVPADVNNE